MLDGVSLDQLRAFIAAVNEGSFSAGVRRLTPAGVLLAAGAQCRGKDSTPDVWPM
jgi:hypothetical protein